MKSFKQFITESVKSYRYTIKIAGEVDKNFIDLLKYNLTAKFDPIKIDDAVTTPIQKSPYGFPGLSNQPITIIKTDFRYPCTEPMVLQIVQLLGYNVNMVRVISTDFDDSINSEAEGYANEADHNPLLLHPELEEQPGAKDASKAYADSYLDSIKKQAEGSKIKMEYAAKTPPSAFDPFKQPVYDKVGLKSPMTTMIRHPKPETGARK
jgi:hypothetical protein